MLSVQNVSAPLLLNLLNKCQVINLRQLNENSIVSFDGVRVIFVLVTIKISGILFPFSFLVIYSYILSLSHILSLIFSLSYSPPPAPSATLLLSESSQGILKRWPCGFLALRASPSTSHLNTYYGAQIMLTNKKEQIRKTTKTKIPCPRLFSFTLLRFHP